MMNGTFVQVVDLHCLSVCPVLYDRNNFQETTINIDQPTAIPAVHPTGAVF